MTYRLKQDPETLMKARTILASREWLLGDEAWTAPDERIVKFAEHTLNSVPGVLAPMRTQLRSISLAVGKTRRGRMLGKALGVYPPQPVDEYERLMECAAR